MKGKKVTKQTKIALKELEGNVDLRRVWLKEMPLKELLRSGPHYLPALCILSPLSAPPKPWF